VKAEELLGGLENRLGKSGLDEIEVYLKRGRSRRFEIGAHGRIAGTSEEEGWAVRASDERSSLFAAGSGAEPTLESWPAPDGRPLRLPAAQPIPAWKSPADLDAPLLVDSEAISLLEAIESNLVREVPGGRLLRGVLEEGTSESDLANSRGVSVGYRSRAAALYLEVAGPWRGSEGASFYLAEREARRFNPAALARQAANRLVLGHEATAPDRDRGEMLLAPPVATRLLLALLPILVGSEGRDLARSLRDRSGRIGSPRLSLLDDGRYPGGVLEAPVDGEGYPTREVALVEEGAFRQPLQSWRQASPSDRAVGCMRRPSWRDVPRIGGSHLYLRPAPETSAAELLSSVARGYYLVDTTGSGHFDLQQDHFNLPVCGLVLRQGRADAPVGGAWLCGAVSSFLRGIQAVARDLLFLPGDGMVGSPTLLVTGLELRKEPG
jgi:predicted Zn-dependent protease